MHYFNVTLTISCLPGGGGGVCDGCTHTQAALLLHNIFHKTFRNIYCLKQTLKSRVHKHSLCKKINFTYVI
jgi:hypothetical protein